MDAKNEILDAIEIMLDRALANTTKIYGGLCKSVVSKNVAKMLINGIETNVQYYGDAPTVNKQYRVFVPEGNMSNAFMVTGGGSGGTQPSVTSYNTLTDKPSINGVTLTGNKNATDFGITGDVSFVYSQTTPTTVWNIAHGLNKYPSVITMDEAGNQIVGDVAYTDINTLTVTFTSNIAGKAYLN